MKELVGVYCRLSNEDRDKVNKLSDSESIINQKSMCIKYAESKGWIVTDIYSDDDFSGAGTYRPEFERLIKDCELGKINIVLCKTQSRFSRDLEVIEKYLHNKFIEWGVRFVSIVDNADTNDDYNKKSRQINGLMNEWYLADLSDNIKRSLKNKREDGLFMGSFAPYGYKRCEYDKHKLVVDPVASLVVKRIFNMYAKGLGYYKIAEYLNNNNIPPRSIYKKQNGSNYVCSICDYDKVRWNVDTIAQILKNEVYIGNLVQGKTVSLGYKIHKNKRLNKNDWCIIENTHEVIIDKKTWNKVQLRLGKHESPIKTGEIHYLSRKVYCMECNKSFMRNVYNVKDGKRAYMQCKGAKKFHDCTNNNAIRMNELEAIIINSINDLINNYIDKEYLNTELNKTKEDNIKIKKETILKKELEIINKNILENKNYYKKLYEDKIKGLVTDDMFILMSSDYTKEIENLNKRIIVINKELDNLLEETKVKEDINELINKYTKITSLNKTIIDEFIDKIYIGKKNKDTKTRDIKIVWNF